MCIPGQATGGGYKSLKNYNIQAHNLHTSNFDAYMVAGRELVKNIMEYEPVKKKHPRLLVLHAGSGKRSNTVNLWNMVKEHLPQFDINEISLRNGNISDCKGCSYDVCRHFGEEGNCFYGGR